jgi:hypothetical protein
MISELIKGKLYKYKYHVVEPKFLTTCVSPAYDYLGSAEIKPYIEALLFVGYSPNHTDQGIFLAGDKLVVLDINNVEQVV